MRTATKWERNDSNADSMKRPNMPYYPPRAGPLSRLWYGWNRLIHACGLGRFRAPELLGRKGGLLSILCPGYIFIRLGFQKAGSAIFLGYLLSAAIFFVAMGHPLAGYAFGLMISVHATSILQLITFWAGQINLFMRIGIALILLLVLAIVIYRPVSDLITDYVATPLRTDEGIVVVNPRFSADDFGRGDVIAYRIDPVNGPGYRIRGGAGIAPVLAIAGDKVRFLPDRYEVNGVSREPLPGMPESSEVEITPGHWLIWPELEIASQGGNNMDMSSVILLTAIVSHEQLIGRVYRHWFGRDQIQP